MIITTLRRFEDACTPGRLFVDGRAFGETLEDPARPEGVKVQNKTCIPEATYLVGISRSPKFGRDMLILHNVRADQSINVRGVRFTGIRAHGGVTAEHTEGCPLVGDTVEGSKLRGNKSQELQALVQAAIDRGEPVYWTFSRDPE